MNKYSESSKRRLETCDKDLQLIFRRVLADFDHSILCGYRGQTLQNKAFSQGYSTLKWPESKHNVLPSQAVDAAPYDYSISGIDWEDIERLTYFAGYVMGVASLMYDEGIVSKRLKWGGDWDRDTNIKDEKFRDLVHFELIDE